MRVHLRHLIAVLSLVVITSSITFGQVAVSLSPVPVLQFLDSSGRPLSNGKLYSYAAGTNILQATYRDSTGNGQNLNPVILSSSGSAQIWLARQSYKLVLQDSTGHQIWSVDGVKDGALSLLTGVNTWLADQTFQAITDFNDLANINAGGTFAGTISGQPNWSQLQTFPAGIQVGATGMQLTQGLGTRMDIRASIAGPAEMRLIPNGTGSAINTTLSMLGTDPTVSGGNDEAFNLSTLNSGCVLVVTPCYQFQGRQTGTGVLRPLLFNLAGTAPSVLFDIDGSTTFNQRMTLSQVSNGGQLRIDPGSGGAPGIRFVGTETSGHSFNVQEDAGHFTIQDLTGPVTLLDLSSSNAQVPSLTVSAFTFTNIGSCTGPLAGKLSTVVDSSTNTWGATITGGGANIVLAFCNGTNWTVAAK